jgi:hypothetical protein
MLPRRGATSRPPPTPGHNAGADGVPSGSSRRGGRSANAGAAAEATAAVRRAGTNASAASLAPGARHPPHAGTPTRHATHSSRGASRALELRAPCIPHGICAVRDFARVPVPSPSASQRGKTRTFRDRLFARYKKRRVGRLPTQVRPESEGARHLPGAVGGERAPGPLARAHPASVAWLRPRRQRSAQDAVV